MSTPQNHKSLYNLVRSYIDTMGASQTTLVALKSYIDAIHRLKCEDADFERQLLELNEVIKNTEPKVIPLSHLIEAFETDMRPHLGAGLENAKTRAMEILSQKLRGFEADTEKLTERCTQSIEPGDFIIAHSPTAYIRQAFARAHTELKRPFEVLVLKQDFLRAKELVSTLEELGIAHKVIPQYNLSHYLNRVTKLFIGAVSVSADQKAVTGVGAANVVSLCHFYKIPVYLFIETIKFAHTPLPNQHIYREQQEKVEADFTFRMTTFSHDFVDLAMVDHLITEEGEKPLK